MHAVVAEVARAKVVEPAPTPVEAIDVKGPHWRRANPHVVVDAFGRLGIGRKSDGTLLGALPCFGDDWFAKCTRFHKLDCRLQSLGRTMLRSHLHDPLVL